MAARFEVQAIFQITGRGIFVGARHLDPEIEFHVPFGSTLGNVSIQKGFEHVYGADPTGAPLSNVFGFLLNDPLTKDASQKGQVVELVPGDHIHYHKPWYATEQDLVPQLNREINALHPLFDVDLKTVARRQDNDDVLFALSGKRTGVAVVHLTWSATQSHSMDYPRTKFFAHWWEVFEDVIVPDSKDWN